MRAIPTATRQPAPAPGPTGALPGAAQRAEGGPQRWRGTYQSALVLGGAQLGGPYGIANVAAPPDGNAVAHLLRIAAELGASHVDTARAYGQSESRIGSALREGGGASLSVITKIAPLESLVTIDAPPAGVVAAAVESSLIDSVAALGSGHRLTVLLHRAADATLAGGAAWRRLREYLAAGVVERIGVSVQSPDEVRAVIGLPDLGYLQLPCNPLDHRWREATDVTETLCRRTDVVVTVRSVYLQGLLVAGCALRWPHLEDQHRDAVVSTLDRVVLELGRQDRADLCVAYVLSLPWVTSVVIGAETEVQVRRNAALVARPPLTPAERERMVAALPELPGDLIDPSRW